VVRSLFGDVLIEDLWTPFFCVYTNLSRGDRMIHERGPLWHAVRASLALPGVFSPVLHEGDVLVDGGITSNYPVDVMRSRVQGGVVIGSNAYPLREHAKPYEFGEFISGWRVLWRSLCPRSSTQVVPSIVETLYGATSINARYQVRALAELADVNVTYPVEGFDPLELAPYAPLVEIGQQEARRALEAWRAQRTRPAPPKHSPAS
jgi:NTE family protein